MIDEETRWKMREMGMGEMVEALDLQERDGASMAVPFDDRVRMMVDYAYEEKYAASVKLDVDEWLTEDVDDAAISFLFELIERRYTSKSTVLCTQYTPAEWHGRLGGGVQADAMVDRLVHGSVQIDLGDVNVRKLLAERK